AGGLRHPHQSPNAPMQRRALYRSVRGRHGRGLLGRVSPSPLFRITSGSTRNATAVNVGLVSDWQLTMPQAAVVTPNREGRIRVADGTRQSVVVVRVKRTSRRLWNDSWTHAF